MPGRYDGPVELFLAIEELPRNRGGSPNLGWDTLASDIRVHHVSGDHDNLLMEPHIGDIARQLKVALEISRHENARALSNL